MLLGASDPSWAVLAFLAASVYGSAAFAGWTAVALVGLTLARRNFWHESY